MDRIREITERVAAAHGVELVELELRGGGKARMLRIYIDKPEGVTHADCEGVSREIGAIFDVEDIVPGGQYTLEVSSPGLDRKLLKPADYQRFAGSRIKVLTREPVDGSRHFEGRLEGLQDGRIALELRPAAGKRARRGSQKPPEEETPAARLEIELANVEKANLVPEF